MTKLEEIARAIEAEMIAADVEYEVQSHAPLDIVKPELQDRLRFARAAVEAMREPSEDMLVCLMHQEGAGFEELKDCWQKAIDAALARKGGE